MKGSLIGRKLRLRLVTACIAGLIAPICAGAAPSDPCDHLPPAVSAYLRHDAAWVPVRLADLNADDQKLWTSTHPAACPGFASGDFEGRGQTAFALALLRHENGVEEKFILLRHKARRLIVTTIVAPYRGASPEVVWRAPPGRTGIGDGTRTVLIKQDSIMFEALESAAQQYYFANGRLHKIQKSD